MKFNYDLVIIGATAEGIYAAQEAARFTNKRIALVTQGLDVKQSLFDAHFQANFTHLIKQKESLLYVKNLGYNVNGLPSLTVLETISKNLSQCVVNADDRLSVLAAQGIDIIEGSATFELDPNLGLTIANRMLRSRFYLITIEGKKEDYFINFSEGKHWAILGTTPENLGWASHLALAGKQITLITQNNRILPGEDRQVSHLLQVYLEVIGVNFIFNAKVTKITDQGSQKILQIKEKKSENKIHQIIVDIVFNSYVRKNINVNLNLKKIGVKVHKNRILVNDYLQTDQPQIYAIGKAIKGYELLEIAQQEALLVIKNCFLFQKLPIYYSQIPYRLMTYPTLSRVGLTEAQARTIYNDKYNKIEVISGNYSAYVPLTNPLIPNFYKFIFAPNKTLIGAHFLSAETGNNLAFLAIAMSQRLTKEQILPLIFPLLSC